MSSSSARGLTAARLRKLVHYDPKTGIMTNLVKRGPLAVGTILGTLESRGYLKIGLDYEEYRVHNLAWLYMTGRWPSHEVDHRDLDGQNNKWRNLRQATRAQNLANQPKRKKNTSGYKGVHFHKATGLYHARIGINCRSVSLGYYRRASDAGAAYLAAAKEAFGEFARA
jgi:HNH endonuclease